MSICDDAGCEQVKSPHPLGFHIWRNRRDWPTHLHRLREAWWIITGQWSLHRAWQGGYDQHIRDDSARRANTQKYEIERAAKAIYDLLPYSEKSPPIKPPWLPGGNSLKQDEARRYARAALALTSTTRQPPPIADGRS